MSRVCAKAINKRQTVPSPSESGLKEITKFDCTTKLIERLQHLRGTCEKHFDSYNFYMAIDEVVATLHMTNGMVQEVQPWKIAKDPAAVDELNTVLALVFESLRINAIILQPIIPRLATRILDKIKVDLNERSWDDAELHFDSKQVERNLNDGHTILMQRIN